jgi:hypothetical protein
MTRFDSVSDALELIAPDAVEERSWEDVLRRAGDESPASRRRTVFLAAALVALAAVGVAATATGTLDRFGGWVSGQLGEPAPPEAQRAFEERNRQAFARFPVGTELRRLLSRTAAGERFDLYGFRHGSWWCLRLVRERRPDAPGANKCLASSQLAERPAPAVVAETPYFRVGAPEQTVDGIFGLATSDVRIVEVVRARGGTTRTTVENNAFLVLGAQPTGSVANHPPANPIIRLFAVDAAGERHEIPFVGSLPDRPRGPSYVAHDTPKAAALPGPDEVEADAGTTVGWLERREPRGEPYAFPRERGFSRRPSWARAIQPDPTTPHRVVLGVTTSGDVCFTDLRELSARPGWFGCGGALGDDSLRIFGGVYYGDAYGPRGPQFTRVSGIASDGVRSLELFLADGARVPVALRDNVFTVEAPFADFPAKLVAYDGDGRVVAIEVQPGPGVLKACPRATPRAAVWPPAPYERIDLGTLTIGGHAILGRSPEEVIAALGAPSRRRERELRYEDAVSIGFQRARGRLWADSIGVFSQNAVDPNLGRFLRLQPGELERRLATTYPKRYRRLYGYGTEPGRGCAAGFKRQPPSARVTVTFGLSPVPFGISPRPRSQTFLFVGRP